MLMHVDKATFIAVDTETTGLRADVERLIEVAAVKVCGGCVVDSFAELINPVQPIPARITRITGIGDHMLAHARTAEQVLPDFVEFLGTAVLVLHNERFDLNFINAELERSGLPPLANQTVCTLRLARRLLRGLPSKSLTSLKGHFGIEGDNAHRALTDATVTYEVFRHLNALLESQHGLCTVDELLRFQRRTYRKTGSVPKNVRMLRETVLPTVPQSPGVYFMYGKNGKILYIGKAKNLARRVRSYFAGTEGKDRWTQQLVRAVHAISYTEMKTELAAILTEHRLRKEHQPPFNRADRGASAKRFSAPPFLRIGAGPVDRRLTVVHHIQDDGAQYFGPFSSEQQARTIVEAFFAMYGEGSATGDDGRFSSLRSAHVGGTLTWQGHAEAHAFLQAPCSKILQELESGMQAASHALDFERAVQYRDWLTVLTNLSRKRFVTGESVYDRNAVILVPAPSATELHFVRHGLPVGELVVAYPLRSSGTSAVRSHVMKHFSDRHVRPGRYTVQQSDQIRLLACWLYRQRKVVTVMPWDTEMDSAAFAADIAAAMHRKD